MNNRNDTAMQHVRITARTTAALALAAGLLIVAWQGTFVETWARGGDGAWRISNDIYNTDIPVAAAEPSMPMTMTHMLITHEVADGEAWLSAWRGEDSRHTLFQENGAAHVHTLQNADNPNLTGLIVAVSDMDTLNAMLASEEGLAAAAADGVDAESITVLVEAK